MEQQTSRNEENAPQPVVASRTPGAAEGRDQPSPEVRSRCSSCWAAYCRIAYSPRTWQQKILCVLLWLVTTAACVAIFAVLIPKALGPPMQKLVRLITRKFTGPQLVFIIIATVALLPFTLVVPAAPFIWIAGMALPFGLAFGIVMLGSVIGMTLQYWTARCLLKNKVEKHLLKRRKDGISIALRAVDIAGPWKVVALVRLGPSPYAAMNYVFGVCPMIRFHQYIIASTVCITHHRALSVFFGAALPTLADLFSGKPVTNVGMVVYRFAVLALGIALCVLIVILAKKALKKLQEQELEREAEVAAQEAAAAAEAGTLPAQDMDAMRCNTTDTNYMSKQPLPLAIDNKMQGAAKHPTSGSDGDLQMIVVDDRSTSTADLSRGSPNNSFIPAGEMPPAALETQPSASGASRMSSLSSLRGLLSQTFRRSG